MNPLIESAMRNAGELVRNAQRTSMHEETKSGAKDFVTQYDVRVQELLFDAIRNAFPDMTLIGEEMDATEPPRTGTFCIVDPIDGTANFMKGVKKSCISVALGKDGTITQGYVYDPYLNEMFAAEAGRGAFVNGTPLVRDNTLDLASSLVCFGTCPYDPNLTSKTFFAAEVIFRRSLDVRRTGTAALDLCYTAANRFDLFFEGALSPWDHAAGALIAREAGCKVCTFDGSDPSFTRKSSVASGSVPAVDEFLHLVTNGTIF